MSIDADHYETLGVARDASADTIKRAWKRKCRAAHPDRSGGNHDDMVAINAAYETLSDPERRARYDLTGKDEPVPPLDALACGAIMQLFSIIVERADDSVDLVKCVRESLQLLQVQARAALSVIPMTVARLEARRKRITYRGERRNFLADLIDEKVRNVQKSVPTIEQQIKVRERALELLAEFGYDVMQGYVFRLTFAGTYESWGNGNRG